MSIPVSAVKRKNPSRPDAPAKWYACSQAEQEMSFTSLCRVASKGRTVTAADISASLLAIEEAMEESLRDGRIIRLGNLGSFRITARSKGAVTEDEFSVNQVKCGHLVFKPGEMLKQVVQTLAFHHVPRRPVRVKKEEAPSV